jgi:hypothetical protein
MVAAGRLIMSIVSASVSLPSLPLKAVTTKDSA